jgi:hypothetical protein
MKKATKKIAPASDATLALATVEIPAPAPGPVEVTPEIALRTLMEIAFAGGRDAEFAFSLLTAAKKGKVSEKQQFHIERLVNAHLNPAAPVANLSRLVGAFKAIPAKRFPKVRATIEGVEVTISYTGEASEKAKPENRGTCAVSSGKWGTPESRWYGRIMANGEFVPGHHLTPAVQAWLASLADPATPIVWSF